MPNLGKAKAHIMSLLRSILTSVIKFYPIRKLLIAPVRRATNRFNVATEHPRELQEALLRNIISRHQHTDFGKDHHFGTIHTPADYRRLPVFRYEDHEPYLARVRRGEFNALLSDPLVHMFAMTSGTTATRKYIPVTAQYLADYRRGWNIWGLKVFQDHPQVRLRPILQMSGDWDEFRTEAGIPCGNLTGLTAQTQKRFIRWLYCPPAVSGRIKDTLAKYYVALRTALVRKVGMMIAANPSTLVNLARIGDQEKESLIKDIHDGTLSAKLDVPADVRAVLASYLKAKPARARELEEIVRRTGTLYPKDYWGAENYLIGTWTGGSVGAYLRHFPRYFGDCPVRDIGLLASEGRMTIPLESGTPSGVLDITSHYFEFIPEAEGDSPKPTVLAAHELKEGERYYILPTTDYGLYRYHIYDVVRVTGFHNKTPLIEFLSKGAHFASITGEKVSEYQVTQAMAQIMREQDLSLTAYSVAPCWDDELPYYGLFVESGDLTEEKGQRLIAALDSRLSEANSEYAAKRESHRLDALRLELMKPGTWQQWDRQRLARNGGSVEQYKHPCLIGDLKFRDGVPVEREVRAEGALARP